MAPTIMKEICFRGSDGCELFASVLGDAVPLVLLHGGGPDRRMFFPLASELASSATVILPDIRGYGQSRCPDPSRHTWNQYAGDVFALLDHLGLERAWLGGAGLGSTIAMKAAVADPRRICGLVLISVEDIEDDAGKAQEAEFLRQFAAKAREEGLTAAWESILPTLLPVIGNMVREAIPRLDRESFLAAMAIGEDRAFRSHDELSALKMPALILAGNDWHHPQEIAARCAKAMGNATLVPDAITAELRDAVDFGQAIVPYLRPFLAKDK
jgi:3-oxoadipate enol-lactonase